MILIHYSDRVDFQLKKRKIPGGADKPGAFFYPEGNEYKWTNRIRHEFFVDDEIAEKIVEPVQEFEAGYFDDVDYDIVEVFVDAKNFRHLKRI